MKLKIFSGLFLLVAVVFIAFSQTRREAFAPAADFPREALVYVQIADLPALIKLWNESKFKGKYLDSENFDAFKNRHLGLKLASRWQEFNDAIGFPVELETLSGLTENQAAIALYDVGKLEFVFIAPMRDEVFAATKLIQNQAKFEQETLDDGTIIYQTNIEADRGRQRQKLLFTNVKGRFVLATSEKLLLRTLANINQKFGKDRLSDDPSFKILSDKFDLHAATIWVNQTALNEDYYFRRYWLMSDVKNLKNIRAGMFDFAVEEEKLIERRSFLLDKPANLSPLDPAKFAQSLAHLPLDIPFYQIHPAANQEIDSAVEKTFFERDKFSAAVKKNFDGDSFDDFDYFSTRDFDYPNENFDADIDEIDEDEFVKMPATNADFSDIFSSAAPQNILTLTAPEILPAPLFVEFRRAAIFNLRSSSEFNRSLFESATAKKFAAQTMIFASGVELKWETKSENNFEWRELDLPMINRKACYATHGDLLILTNDAAFLQKIVETENTANTELDAPFNSLTVINLEQKNAAFEQFFAKLESEQETSNFFTGNIKSLLDSIGEAKKIEVRKNYRQNFLDEEITIIF